MEENVALDSSKQKKFVKSIKGIKKLIKKNTNTDPKKPIVTTPENGAKTKKLKRYRKPKGLVYLSHIPHGFYEHQMTEYFKQFGGVSNVRVIRSKRTGNSRGCAFVEFKEATVAEIVVETMNNYLMGKRIIKAEIVPPEKQKKAFRKNWSSTHNPGTMLRTKMKKNFNANKDEAGDLARAKKIISNLQKTKNKLNELGIQFDFAPVDVPEELMDIVNQLKTDVEDVKDVKEKETEKTNKKGQKTKDAPTKKQEKPVKDTKVISKQQETSKPEKAKAGKTSANNTAANKKLKEKGVIPLDSFIKIQSDDDEDLEEEESSDEDIEDDSGDESNEGSDDSVIEFDEEAYDKMLENSGDSDLSDEEDISEDGDSDSDISDEQPKITKTSKIQKKTPVQPKVQNIQANKRTQPKRKINQKVDVSPKKPKFEKKVDTKLKKKQFKVKK